MTFAVGKPCLDGGCEGGDSASGEAYDAMAVVDGEVGVEAFEGEDH